MACKGIQPAKVRILLDSRSNLLSMCLCFRVVLSYPV